MFAAVALFGVANLVFTLFSLFWLFFVALLVAGGADMVSMYIRSSLIQFSTPDAMRGRVNAVNMLFIGSSNELCGWLDSSRCAGSTASRRPRPALHPKRRLPCPTRLPAIIGPAGRYLRQLPSRRSQQVPI
ncbi:hypothetical protein SAMN04244579_04768 [Azotobacter beijerinckii]|uniref:Transmembrane secretion effector n=1 Tax=Azotobacter beijerinckii TaxID=170623 RepID=A0A1H6ZNG3_9GAMM|nr:hypothetical protein SAMN04244579_04768 [Azotobacter beijerinckii]